MLLTNVRNEINKQLHKPMYDIATRYVVGVWIGVKKFKRFNFKNFKNFVIIK